MAISDLDLLRCAKLVLDHYGEDADSRAERADELLDCGDVEGSGVWRKIGSILEATPLAATGGPDGLIGREEAR